MKQDKYKCFAMPIFEAAKFHCFFLNSWEYLHDLEEYGYEIIIITWVNLIYFNYAVVSVM